MRIARKAETRDSYRPVPFTEQADTSLSEKRVRSAYSSRSTRVYTEFDRASVSASSFSPLAR